MALGYNPCKYIRQSDDQSAIYQDWQQSFPFPTIHYPLWLNNWETNANCCLIFIRHGGNGDDMSNIRRQIWLNSAIHG
jgi:hypothetical protein